MISAFPKIFALGSPQIERIFNGEVEITEKIDGSQFCFGLIDNELVMRSKGKIIYRDCVDKMFSKAVDYVVSIENKIPNNTIFYCEYLRNPKHNVLSYGRIPKNNLMLFGVSTPERKFVSIYINLRDFADLLEIERVPLLDITTITNSDDLKTYLNMNSILGNVKIEGIVVKNYNTSTIITENVILPIMSGKYVSETFKETHKKNWSKENTSKGALEIFKEQFRTEARWLKAIQHLKDDNKLEFSPRDIGKLLKAINIDIQAEEEENIKNGLYKIFKSEILRYANKGFPEWYKEQLLEKAFK
jgi:hypothetical protein